MIEFGVPLGPAHDRLDARDQLGLVEGLGQIVVGAADQPAHLVGGIGAAGEDQHRRQHPPGPQAADHLVAVDVGQPQVEHDDVEIVQLGELEPVLAAGRRLADHVLALERMLDQASRNGIILDHQCTHRLLQPALGLDVTVGGAPLSRR